MTEEPEADALRNAWQSQKSQHPHVSMEEIKMTAERLQRRVRNRNILGATVFALLIIAFTSWAVTASNAIERAGAILTVAAVAYMGLQLIQYRRVETGSAVTAEHLRAELSRQRDYHRGPAFWSRFVLIAPGPLLVMTGFAVAHPYGRLFTLLDAAVFVLLLILAVPVQRREAAHYQREIDRIEALTGEQLP
jgi:hypothetical protein